MGQKFYGVKLDNRVIKTMYKDDLFIPSRALAVALAEEWESQGEFLDIRQLYINNMMAKGVRAMHDPSLTSYMEEELQRIFEND